MFDAVPARYWLLLLIAIIGFAPARYVYRHVTRSPSRRDITQPQEDLTWRSPRTLAVNVAILVGLAALAVFIFTPAAAEFARSPSFVPILMIGLGGFALWSVISGYMSGTIEPMVRGASWKFDRAEQPKRYWASMSWNGLLGIGLLFFSGQLLVDAPMQALRDRCHDYENERPATDELTACNRLLSEHPNQDRSSVIAARGSAYYRMRDYRRAGADYATAIGLDPNASSSHYNLGLVHEALGARESAIADYSAAVSVDPKNAEAYSNRGLIFLDTGRFDQAISDFTNAHELQPANVEPLANRGLAFAWSRDAARAEQDFAAVRTRDESNLVVLHGEGVLAMARGDMAGAVRLFSVAIAREADDAWAYSMRAAAYGRLGEHQKMQADAEIAERLRRRDGQSRGR